MTSKLPATSLGKLRLLAIVEGISFLLILFVTMPLKYLFDQPLPNQIVGMAHGILFVAYCLYVLIAWREYKWSVGKTLLALIASVIPFGTFVADWKLFRD
jgi:integral membrane protein